MCVLRLGGGVSERASNADDDDNVVGDAYNLFT